MALKSWKEVPIGGIILDAGSSANFKTGTWKITRPVIDFNKCTHCMVCFMYCPEPCIIAKDGKIDHIDYDFCKGCGVCKNQCPMKCIEMKNEFEFKKD